MKASYVKEALKSLIESKRPTFIWGAPGVGKSQVVQQVAKELKLEVRDVRAVLLDPVDLRGLPHINGDHRAHWCPPEFLPREGRGILFLDELNAAPPLVQAACYQLVLDRKLGEYELPEGWTVIAAGNRESDRAVVHRMTSALANRFVHLDFDVDLNDWVEWARAHDVASEVIAFLRFKPGLLHAFDPKLNERAFPTPRSWEFVSDILKNKITIPAVEFEVLKGTVGEGTAAEFSGFLRVFRSLPNIDLILQNPDQAEVPTTKPDVLYALTGALSRRATAKTAANLLKYYNRLPAEFSVLAVRDSVAFCPEMVNTKEYVDWATKHSDMLI
jgi:hypothetical protein